MANSRTRPIAEMIGALQRHVELLRDYSHRLFDLGQAEYGGEVAGKLRLLATKSGSNSPLLIRLMRETGIEPRLRMGGPPIPLEQGVPMLAGQELSLEEFFKLPAMGVRVPSGEFMMLSKHDFIRAWAEKMGAPHEDWTMSEPLSTILGSQIYIGGLQGAVAELRTNADAVLHIADRFLAEYDSRGAA